jgi:hypothetical protein
MGGLILDQLMPFIQERWFVVVAAIIVLFIVIKIVKTVMKWILVLAIVAGVLFYGANYVDQIKEVGGGILQDAKSSLRDEALKALAGEDASYKQNEDGSFIIVKGNIQLEGKSGSSDVKITFMGQSVTLKADDALKALIEQAKKNAGAQ